MLQFVIWQHDLMLLDNSGLVLAVAVANVHFKLIISSTTVHVSKNGNKLNKSQPFWKLLTHPTVLLTRLFKYEEYLCPVFICKRL